MRPDRLSNMTPQSVLRDEFSRLEPAHILRVVEEVLHDTEALPDTHGNPRQDDFLQNDAVRIDAGEVSCRDQYERTVFESLENEEWARQECDGGIGTRHAEAVRLGEGCSKQVRGLVKHMRLKEWRKKAASSYQQKPLQLMLVTI